MSGYQWCNICGATDGIFLYAIDEPAAGAAALECNVSVREYLAQTSSFVTISHGDVVPVWIIDPARYDALLRKNPNLLSQIEEWKRNSRLHQVENK